MMTSSCDRHLQRNPYIVLERLAAEFDVPYAAIREAWQRHPSAAPRPGLPFGDVLVFAGRFHPSTVGAVTLKGFRASRRLLAAAGKEVP